MLDNPVHMLCSSHICLRTVRMLGMCEFSFQIFEKTSQKTIRAKHKKSQKNNPRSLTRIHTELEKEIRPIYYQEIVSHNYRRQDSEKVPVYRTENNSLIYVYIPTSKLTHAQSDRPSLASLALTNKI